MGQCSSTATNFGWRDPQGAFRDIMATQCTTNECDNNAANKCARDMRFSHDGDYIDDQGVNQGPIGNADNNCTLMCFAIVCVCLRACVRACLSRW